MLIIPPSIDDREMNTLYHIITTQGKITLDNELMFIDYAENVNNNTYKPVERRVLSHLNSQ